MLHPYYIVLHPYNTFGHCWTWRSLTQIGYNQIIVVRTNWRRHGLKRVPHSDLD